jgi:Domain of unknown function (DUF929)
MSPDAPEQDAVPVVHMIPRRYVALGLIIVAIVLLAALVFIRHKDNNNTQPTTAETFSPAPVSLIQALAQVPAAASNAVGVTTPNSTTVAPTATRNPSVWTASTRHATSVPVVFFYGAEFAPYAAAERWPLIVALSRFGTFGQLGLLQSSGSDAFSGTDTFTFSHATYSSDVIDLQTDERYSTLIPTGARYVSLQKPTRRQAASVAAYDTSATTFPLLDIANRYVLVGSGFSPSVLAGLSQTQIAADLSVPENPVAQVVLASANEITAAVCTVTGQLPGKVCHARGVLAADQKMHITH